MALSDIMSGFANAFKPNAPAATPAATDPSAGNPLVPGADTGVSDGSVKAIPKAGEGEQSPLDGYKDMWQAADTDLKVTSLVPDMKVDPKLIMEQAKKFDFSKAISPELTTKALAGDAAAFGQVLNQAIQASFAQQTHTTTRIVEAALTEQEKRFNDVVLPAKLREHNISAGLRAEENSLFSNPATAPVLSMIEQQLQIKNPTAPASEIQKLAKKYVSDMGLAIVTGDGKVVTDKPLENKMAREDTDFSTWTG